MTREQLVERVFKVRMGEIETTLVAFREVEYFQYDGEASIVVEVDPNNHDEFQTWHFSEGILTRCTRFTKGSLKGFLERNNPRFRMTVRRTALEHVEHRHSGKPLRREWLIDQIIDPNVERLVIGKIFVPHETKVVRPKWVGEELTGPPGFFSWWHLMNHVKLLFPRRSKNG